MAMAKYDLTPRIAPNLDRHLVFPLLEFTQERELYPNDQILKAKIELLNNTNMVDYAMDIHKVSVPHGLCSSRDLAGSERLFQERVNRGSAKRNSGVCHHEVMTYLT
ncbi:eukaryotic translation initiation factor 3 subunit E-like [Helianthus annuus]|uniref:eukaryotic translation initiation factor 3 subunit E-like n=1 Tax=Helianthus annuus TaxID=4232 RepID=UPI000B902692|nr:eukaryotic translation initiation factor 3 subunit E-like [Helianthus annuus]